MPTSENADQRAERLLALGLQLADNVREVDPAEYVRPLRRLSRDELEHLAVLLAACVDIDRAPTDLLAWWYEPASATPPDVSPLIAERFDLPSLAGERYR